LTALAEIGNSGPMGEEVETGARAVREAHLTEDRRHRSLRATDRRRAAEDALLDALLLPHNPVTRGVGSEGQTLLSRALTRLERLEGVDAIVAWAAETGGDPKVLAAQPAHSAGRIHPTREIYDALMQLERVQRLTDGDLGVELTALAARGVSVVAPIKGLGAAPAAVLLVYSKRPGRPLRPRTIAVLAEVAAKLSHSMSTNLALDRLGQLDEAVQRLDRLASLGGLVSEIVHEIRNPLVSVKTFLQLLPERLDDPEFHQDFRKVVGDEVQRLERMLDDLLRHARPKTTPEIGEGARVSEVIQTTLQLMTYRCRERGVVLDTQIRSELPTLALSQDALRQLLLNLLLNASQVTPEGGRIVLSVDWSIDEVNHLEIKIEDDGPGIDASLGDRIFEPFWTTRSEAAGGLGLAICKRIVEEAGGAIAANNRREGGACFRVDLPIAS
jgi:signal transduction histidine kinase